MYKSLNVNTKDDLIDNLPYIDEQIDDLTKTQILALDTVVDLSSPKDKTKLFAYNVEDKTYVVFSFTNKNEMVLVDYVRLHNGNVISLTYPDALTTED